MTKKTEKSHLSCDEILKSSSSPPYPLKLISCRSTLNPHGSLCTLLPSGSVYSWQNHSSSVVSPWRGICVGIAHIYISHFSQLGSASRFQTPPPENLFFFWTTNPCARPAVSELSMRECKTSFLPDRTKCKYSVSSIPLHLYLFFTGICTWQPHWRQIPVWEAPRLRLHVTVMITSHNDIHGKAEQPVLALGNVVCSRKFARTNPN